MNTFYKDPEESRSHVNSENKYILNNLFFFAKYQSLFLYV